ncbi:MAG: AAA family ATPase [Verrucomicrobiae bacterium]|nr:AAA family ATPase [Verrucomicrobiae bacterium]
MKGSWVDNHVLLASIFTGNLPAMFLRRYPVPDHSFFLFGPRGTGKSTWLRQVLPDAVWFDLLRTHTLLGLTRQPESFRQQVEARPQGGWVVVDEVQRLPSLLNEVHALIAETGRKYRFALSGSSACRLKRLDVNLLAGRAVNRQFFPLTASELNHDFDLDRVLRFGLLPQIHAEPEHALDVLDAYVSNYIREEIQQEALVRTTRTSRRKRARLPVGDLGAARVARGDGVSQHRRPASLLAHAARQQSGLHLDARQTLGGHRGEGVGTLALRVWRAAERIGGSGRPDRFRRLRLAGRRMWLNEFPSSSSLRRDVISGGRSRLVSSELRRSNLSRAAKCAGSVKAPSGFKPMASSRSSGNAAITSTAFPAVMPVEENLTLRRAGRLRRKLKSRIGWPQNANSVRLVTTHGKFVSRFKPRSSVRRLLRFGGRVRLLIPLQHQRSEAAHPVRQSDGRELV